MHTDNAHDVVKQQDNTFENFMRTSHLAPIEPEQRSATVSPKLR